MLRRYSQHHNLKLAVIAEELVTTGGSRNSARARRSTPATAEPAPPPTERRNIRRVASVDQWTGHRRQHHRHGEVAPRPDQHRLRGHWRDIVCGLSGEIRFDGGPADVDAVACISAVMEPRGPDGHGLWHDGPVALAHRRLAIIDLTETGAQPMVDARAAAGHGVQRLHLQLQAAARGAAGLRLPVLLHLRHRGDRQGLPPVGRRIASITSSACSPSPSWNGPADG